MAAAVTTKTTELGDSRVRLEVEVPSEALERELSSAAAELGREMRVPGFRSGKVPAQVVLRQVGREAVMDEAVRRGLPGWYEEAVADAGITTGRRPQARPRRPAREGRAAGVHDRGGRGAAGQARRLQGPRGRPPRADASTPSEVQAELERMRESLASLETVERAGRRAATSW